MPGRYTIESFSVLRRENSTKMGLIDASSSACMLYVGFTADGWFYQSAEGSKSNTRFFVSIFYVPAAMFDEPHLSKRTRWTSSTGVSWRHCWCVLASGAADAGNALTRAAINFLIDFLLTKVHMLFWSAIFQYMEDA